MANHILVFVGAAFACGCISPELASNNEPPIADGAMGLDAGMAKDGGHVAADAGLPDTAPDARTMVDAGDVEPDAADPVVTPVPATYPAGAAGSDSALVVWADERNGDFDIYGTRVLADGTPLDPDGIAIATAAGDQVTPEVAYGQSGYLVVWKDDRAGKNAIYAARVSEAGEVLDPGGLAVATRGGSTQLPDVASAGGDFLVVWEGPCAATGCVHGVSAARISATGELGETIRVSPPGTPSYTPTVAADSDGYFVLWADIRSGAHDLYGRFVTPAGELDGPEVAISNAPGNQVAPALASDGAGFLAVWQDTRAGVFQTYAARITAEGESRDPDGIQISDRAIWLDGPSAAASNGDYLVAWTEARTGLIYVETAHLDPDTGEIFDRALVSATPSAGGSPLFDHKHPFWAPLDTGTVVGWQSPWEEATTIYGGVIVDEAYDPEARIISTRVGGAP